MSFSSESTVLYPLNIKTHRDMNEAIARIGADLRSNVYFQPKRNTRHIYITHADFRAAAYMKQEILARGGDAVVGKHVMDAKATHSDVLLVGTEGVLNALLQKMGAMDCWGLKDLRERMGLLLENIARESWRLLLPKQRKLLLDSDTKIMGILNMTTDSFFSGSRLNDEKELLHKAEKMLREGADILDVGAESTRPGSDPVPEKEEIERLIPALKSLRKAFPDAVLSVDTYKGKVAQLAADAGADIINDVGGFELSPDMLQAAARSGLPYVLSHIKGTPPAMQNAPEYENLLAEVHSYFQNKIEKAEQTGLSRERLIVDPGLGFGKKMNDNLLLIKEAECFKSLGCPILLGHSRKKFTGTITGTEGAEDRLQATAALSALLEGRVQIVRVHDVRENRQALLAARAVRKASL